MLGTLDPGQVERLLRDEVIGRIGCAVDGRVYVVPVTYAYDDGCVYAHSAEGTKIRMMRASPEVCFEVEQLDGLSSWRSVIAWGHYEELTGAEAEDGMRILLDRLAPLWTSATAVPSHGRPEGHPADGTAGDAVLYRIRLEEKTGRFEHR